MSRIPSTKCLCCLVFFVLFVFQIIVPSFCSQCDDGGQVFSFGFNDGGRLGDGTTTDRWTPVAVYTSGVLNGKTITAISGGGWYSLVLSSTGQVFSWGYNGDGQLGDGTGTNSNTAVAVYTSGVLNGKTIAVIAAGYRHSLVLSSSGQVFSFGWNDNGQLGDGTNTARKFPVAVYTSGVLNGKTITAISAGYAHSLVLSSSGQVFSFGYNYYGQLGDGTNTDRNIPVAVYTSGVLSGKTITAISAGRESHSLVLSSSGQVFSFGRNDYGQLGDGTNTNSNIPVAVSTSGVLSGKTIAAISGGGYHSLVLSSTGKVFSFGRNNYGQLGDGTNTDRTTPVAVSTSGVLSGKTITALAAGDYGHSFVLTSTGQVFSFGYNENGQLGDGTNTASNIPVAVDTSGVLNGKKIIEVSVGGWHSIVLGVSLGNVTFDSPLPYLFNGQSNVAISWCGPGAVTIELIRDGSATIDEIVSNWGGGSPFIWSSVSASDTPRSDFRFQIRSTTYPSVSSTSSNPFEIDTAEKKIDSVNTPSSYLFNGQSSVAINWTSSGHLGDITIELIRDGSGTIDEIVSNWEGGSPFIWTSVSASDAPRSDFRFRIKSSANPSVSPTSSNPFEIDTAEKRIDSVNTPSYLFVGQSNVAINWTSSGHLGDITIELTRDGSGTIDEIVSNWGGGQPFTWASVSASDALRSDYRFQIKSTTYPSVPPTSSNRFEIDTIEKKIQVQVTPPSNGLEYHINGENVEISWTSQGHVGEFIKIEICRGESCITITSSISIDSTPQTWQVNGFDGYSREYFIRITSLELSYVVGESSLFEIDTAEKRIDSVNTPTSYLFVGQSNVPISWTSIGHLGNITIELIQGEDNDTINEIVLNWGGGSPFMWTISNQSVDSRQLDFRFRIKSATYPSVSPQTSDTFEIDTAEKKIESMSISSPFLYIEQSNVSISWTTSGYLGNLTIELIRDGNDTVDEVVSNWGEGSPFIWETVNVSDAPRTDFRFQIVSDEYPSVFNSTNPFDIDIVEKKINSVGTPSSYLVVGEPNIAINWTSQGYLEKITIELIRDESATIDEIVSNWEGGSPFTWSIVSASDAPRRDFRFRVRSSIYPSVFETSDSFEIGKSFDLVDPKFLLFVGNIVAAVCVLLLLVIFCGVLICGVVMLCPRASNKSEVPLECVEIRNQTFTHSSV